MWPSSSASITSLNWSSCSSRIRSTLSERTTRCCRTHCLSATPSATSMRRTGLSTKMLKISFKLSCNAKSTRSLPRNTLRSSARRITGRSALPVSITFRKRKKKSKWMLILMTPDLLWLLVKELRRQRYQLVGAQLLETLIIRLKKMKMKAATPSIPSLTISRTKRMSSSSCLAFQRFQSRPSIWQQERKTRTSCTL